MILGNTVSTFKPVFAEIYNSFPNQQREYPIQALLRTFKIDDVSNSKALCICCMALSGSAPGRSTFMYIALLVSHE